MIKSYKKILPNGLTCVLLPYKVNSVTAILRGKAGSNYETALNIGAAHAVEHLLANSNKELSQKITFNGGKIIATTSREDVAYIIKSLKSNVNYSFELLSEILYKHEMGNINLDITKNAIKQEIFSNIENPKKYIGRIHYKALFKNSRLTNFNTGNIEDVDKLDIETLKDFINTHYFANNFVLSVCGDLTQKEFVKLLNKHFNKNMNRKSIKSTFRHEKNDDFNLILENRINLKQSYVGVSYHGYKLSEPNKYKSLVLSKIFQTYLSSNLVKNQIPTYNLDTSSFSANSYGLFGTFATVNKKDLTKFFQIYFKTAQILINLDIPDQLIHRAINKLEADMFYMIEKTSWRASYYSELELFNNVATSFEEEIEYIKSVNAKNIKDSSKYIFSQKPKVTLIGNGYKENDVKEFLKKVIYS